MTNSNAIVETRCIFCGAGLGKFMGMCPDGERHCHYCRAPESHAANSCIPQHEHYFTRGHEFQRVPIQ